MKPAPRALPVANSWGQVEGVSCCSSFRLRYRQKFANDSTNSCVCPSSSSFRAPRSSSLIPSNRTIQPKKRFGPISQFVLPKSSVRPCRVPMEKTDRIFVAGADTMIGLAVLKALRSRGYIDIVGDGTDTPNLTDFAAVNNLFGDTHPDYVFVTGGKSGGIEANRKYPADLMLDN